jgi:hypothetical protein
LPGDAAAVLRRLVLNQHNVPLAVRFALAAVAALVVAPSALALDCPNVPLDERLAAADVAFVGRVTAERPGAGGQGVVYRFTVDQRVKGELGSEVEVSAGAPLVDAADEPLVRDEALGVLARLDGARIVTDSCLLTDPGALLSTSDEPKGDWIKIVIGLVILALVVAYSVRRLRKRELPSRSSLDG